MNYILFYILRAHFNAKRACILLYSLILKTFPITCKICASLRFFSNLEREGFPFAGQISTLFGFPMCFVVNSISVSYIALL